MVAPESIELKPLRRLLLVILAVGSLLLTVSASASAITRLRSPTSSSPGAFTHRIQAWQKTEEGRAFLAQHDAVPYLRFVYTHPHPIPLDFSDMMVGLALVLFSLCGLRSVAVAEGKRAAALRMTITRRDREPIEIVF